MRSWRESPQKSVYNFSLKSRREGRIEKYNNKNGVYHQSSSDAASARHCLGERRAEQMMFGSLGLKKKGGMGGEAVPASCTAGCELMGVGEERENAEEDVVGEKSVGGAAGGVGKGRGGGHDDSFTGWKGRQLQDCRYQ